MRRWMKLHSIAAKLSQVQLFCQTTLHFLQEPSALAPLLHQWGGVIQYNERYNGGTEMNGQIPTCRLHQFSFLQTH